MVDTQKRIDDLNKQINDLDAEKDVLITELEKLYDRLEIETNLDDDDYRAQVKEIIKKKDSERKVEAKKIK